MSIRARGFCWTVFLIALSACAASDLQTEFGSASVDDWRRSMDYEDVRYRALGVATVPAQPWVNRPTFQRVVQINGWHR